MLHAQPRRISVSTWLTLATCVGLYVALDSLVVRSARDHDFLNLYTGATLALHGDFARMHVPEVQLALERQLVPGTSDVIPFVRPPFYALLLAPLALLQFDHAFAVWLCLQTLILWACWWWAFRRWGQDALIFGALYLPTALGIGHGQDCVLLLAIMIGVYVLACRQRDFAAGLALSLGLFKFHLFLLWPLGLVAGRRWKMLAGAAAGVVSELAIWVSLSGPRGFVEYFRLLNRSDLTHLNPSPELWISVHGLADNLDLPWAKWALAGLVALLVLAAAWKAPLWRLMAATSAGCLLAAPHVYGYDAAQLLLGCWLAIFCSGWLPARAVATALCTPLPFLFALAGKPWAAASSSTLLFFLVALAALGLKAFPNQSRKITNAAEAELLVEANRLPVS